jgi:hypothetical protein
MTLEPITLACKDLRAVRERGVNSDGRGVFTDEDVEGGPTVGLIRCTMNENEWFVEALSLGLVIPATKEFSAKVKELFDAGLIKAEQIEDWESGNPIWVCKGLSDATRHATYQKRAAAANAQVQAQMRSALPPVPTSGPPELRNKAEQIRRDLEKAIKAIKLF